MKTLPTGYESYEASSKRRPVELYHFQYGSVNWYYNNSDQNISHLGKTWVPATINRQPLSYKMDYEPTSCRIQLAYLTDSALIYMAQNPLDPTWVTVRRIFLDQTPHTSIVVFVGQVRKVSLFNVTAELECGTYDLYLGKVVPHRRVEPQCHFMLFGTECGVTPTIDYYVDSSVTVITPTTLNAVGASWRQDGFYTRGYITKLIGGTEQPIKVMVTSHRGSAISLRYPYYGLSTADNIRIYAGCDGLLYTCYAKFNNVINHGGFPFTPYSNPCFWR